MNREIYERNIESIRGKYGNWAEYLEQEKYRTDGRVRVETERAVTGEPVFRVAHGSNVLYLNGKYNPAHAGKDWLKEAGEIEEFAPVVIIGIHDAVHIRNILSEAPVTANVLIYEPSLEIFLKTLEEVDISFLFAPDVPVGLLVDGINEKEQEILFHYMISYDNMTLLKVCMSGNYDKLFPEKVGAFVAELKKYISDIRKNWNTTVRYTNVNGRNVFHNLKYMYDGYSIRALMRMLPEEVPTIVVSAGPSLNKNIEDLKQAVGKANIVATDTAMKPLLNAGIIPNFFVVVDGLKPGNLFAHKDISKVPMVTMNAISVEPMQMHKGKKFYYPSGTAIEGELYQRAVKKDKETMGLPGLASGGSVATSAYSLGIFMGSRTIILVGQDLAMTGNRTHADGTFQEKMDEINTQSGEYFEIEAVDGGKVLTRMDFKMYLDWFEEQIQTQSRIRVIDATEGGAKIHGAEVMTLKEAIAKTCKKDFNVRYKVARLPQMFGEAGKEVVLKMFEEIPGKLVEVQKKARTGLRQYERLEKLSKKKQYTRTELDKLLKQIGKTNRYMETDYMATTVNDSLKGLEMTLRASIYEKKEETKDEMADIAQNGKLMMKAMDIAAGELLELAEQTVVPFAAKQRAKNAKKAGKK